MQFVWLNETPHTYRQRLSSLACIPDNKRLQISIQKAREIRYKYVSDILMAATVFNF